MFFVYNRELFGTNLKEAMLNTDRQTSQALLCLAVAMLFLKGKGTEEVKTFHHTNQVKRMAVGGGLLSRNLVTHKGAKTCVRLSLEQFYSSQDAGF